LEETAVWVQALCFWHKVMGTNMMEVKMGCESICSGKKEHRNILKGMSHKTEYFEDISEMLL
jgi:hypothetical protein